MVLINLFVVQTGAQTVVESYGSDSTLQKGIIVKLTNKDARKIEPVSQDNLAKMKGVVVAANDAPVTLSGSTTAKQQVYVATFGSYDVLVSNQNGSIKAGDYISISALAGIGMKATEGQQLIVGKALAGFDGHAKVLSSATLNSQSNRKVTVSLGLVPVDLGIARNPLYKDNTSNLPGFLQRSSDSLAGKPVAALRIYLGIVVLAVTTVIAGSLLYAGVRSSMVSIGRNPLAKRSITRSLLQVMMLGLTVFLSGLLGVYLLLKL